MSFLIEDYEVLEKSNQIWDKVSNSIKKVFNIQLKDNEKYLKTKVKFYEGKINTDFYSKGILLEQDSHCICLSVILIDSISKNGKNYYPQVFLHHRKKGVKIY